MLSGSATLSFWTPRWRPWRCRPGSVVQLTAGMQTVWTVHETLRKVYVAG